MTEKELYTSPEVKVFNVRIEGVICGSNFGDPGQAGGSLGLDDPGFNYGGF